MLSDAFKYQQFVGHTLGYILIMENFTESLIVGRSLGLIETPLVPKKKCSNNKKSSFKLSKVILIIVSKLTKVLQDSSVVTSFRFYNVFCIFIDMSWQQFGSKLIFLKTSLLDWKFLCLVSTAWYSLIFVLYCFGN